MDWLVGFLSSCMRTSTPLLIAGLGVVFSSRAGTLNLGTEGFMLWGALAGVLGSYYTGSAYMGALIAMLVGLLLAVLFGLFVVTLKANQTVVGIAINLFCTGTTTLVSRTLLDSLSSVTSVHSFSEISIPLLGNIPIIGPAFFSQTILVYLAYISVPVAYYVMQRTAIGLQIRSVGDNPLACDTMGIKVNRLRWGTILYSGAMTGLAGAFMSLGNLSFFTEGMIAGRGYMVMAVVTFGNFTPIGVMLASLLFGASEALQYRFLASGSGIPYQISMMIPYLITVIALCGMLRKKNNAPLYAGVPYIKE